MIKCPLCNHRFDPTEHVACLSCPIKSGCELVCCPTCGYQMVDVDQSSLARLISRFISQANNKKNSGNDLTLIDVPRGHRAKVMGFAKTIPPDRKAHLKAYGLMAGHWVRVLQHSPITVVQIEHTELAIERDLAERIRVGEVSENKIS